MKAQGVCSGVVVALISALGLFSDDVVAASSGASVTCSETDLGDGYCDNFNNYEACGYDGGDCCSCTCVSTETRTCGEYGEYACLDPSASCVDDDDVTMPVNYEDDPESTTSLECYDDLIADGDCDLRNNVDRCDYDGGDCCECTCVSTEAFTCGDSSRGGYSCLDPSAECVDDDDVTTLPESETFSDSETTAIFCLEDAVSDGVCDSDNNIEECGFDGGDCCECDCVSTDGNTCGDNGGYDCVDPSSSCINDYVLASTKTAIGVSANAFDTRPGGDTSDHGCGDDGCAPELSRDGISADIESRWSCAPHLVLDGSACAIVFTFEEPQDIMEVQVAFWKNDERDRSMEASINGEVIGDIDSYAGSTFNALGIQGNGVSTLTLTSIDYPTDHWISLIEVRFLVEA